MPHSSLPVNLDSAEMTSRPPQRLDLDGRCKEQWRPCGPDIVQIHHVQTSADSTLQLAEQVQRFCDTESFDAELKSNVCGHNTRGQLSVGYTAPVLWIDDVLPEIPDSNRTAESRLKSLKNKFARDSGLELKLIIN